jgi:hypothetical protein
MAAPTLKIEKERFVANLKAYNSSTPPISVLAQAGIQAKASNGDNPTSSQSSGAIKTNQNSGNSRAAAQSTPKPASQVTQTK